MTSPEITRIEVMMLLRFPVPLRKVHDRLHERGIDITHGTVRVLWSRLGQICAAEHLSTVVFPTEQAS